MTAPAVRIAPSVLACDFAALGEAARAVEAGGADLLHVDVMDGRFVPNISIGIPIVEALKRVAGVPLDVHLMVIEPERHIEAFAMAGAAMISVHLEATPHLHRTLSAIRAHGLAAGAAVNPGTPVDALKAVANQVDYVVVMSVNPGYAGQLFIPESTARVGEARALLDAAGNRAPVEVDGGVSPANAAELVAAGAEILVAASAIYGAENPASATHALREAALSGLAVAGEG
ncbi:MAG: ribulose-phosphate 3-epimerase [Acidobacteria bacterium]|nr:ribulose-phosphate 3-epimerase [Acidobacteriota bacterium]MYJ03612.1 ribulose-phosphate 3-epimerase [Acidobacteriota bacterium]